METGIESSGTGATDGGKYPVGAGNQTRVPPEEHSVSLTTEPPCFASL